MNHYITCALSSCALPPNQPNEMETKGTLWSWGITLQNTTANSQHHRKFWPLCPVCWPSRARSWPCETGCYARSTTGLIQQDPFCFCCLPSRFKVVGHNEMEVLKYLCRIWAQLSFFGLYINSAIQNLTHLLLKMVTTIKFRNGLLREGKYFSEIRIKKEWNWKTSG